MPEPAASIAYRVSVYPLQHVDGLDRWTSLRNLALEQAHVHPTPFSVPSFVEAFCAHQGLTCEIWLVADDTNDLAGLLVFKKKQGPFTRAILPGFIPHSPFLYAGKTQPEDAIMLLLNKLGKEFDDVRIHFPPFIDDARSFRWTGWQSSVFYTYQIDLAAYNVDRSSWSKATRRNFQKHASSYLFKEDASLTGHCISLCSDGYERNSRPFPINPQSLLNICTDLQKKQMVRSFVVLKDEHAQPEAGIVVLQDDKTAYYWIAGSLPGPAMTVLIGNVLEALKESGLQTFDFVGANTPGIAEFKRRFGPTLVPYYGGWQTSNFLLDKMLKFRHLFSG